MMFLTPLIAGIAAAIAIPSLVILYFLKLRRRDVEVSTTLLWKKAIEDLQANAPFQRLRNNILLILQLLALCIALFAVAQPQIRSDLTAGTAHVILIDTSASMNAVDGDPTNLAEGTPRLEAAKKQAIDLVNALRDPGLIGESGDRAMVITFDAGAAVRQNFTSSKAELRAAIESIMPTDSSTSIKEAVKLAKAYSPRVTDRDAIDKAKGMISSGGPTVIHIFSDGGLPETAGEETAADAKFDITADDKVLYHPIGSKDSGNVGITGLRADRAFDKPTQLQIFVGLQSTFKTTRDVDVQVAIDGRVVGVKGKPMAAALMKLPDGQTFGVRRMGPGMEATQDPSEEMRRDMAGEAARAANAAKGVTPAATEKPDAEKTDAAAKSAPAPAAATEAATNSEPVPVLVPTADGIVFSLDRAEGGIVTVQLIHPTSLDDPASKDMLQTDDIAYISVPPAKRLSVAMVSPGNMFLRELLEGLNLSKLEIIPPGDGQAFFNSARRDEFDIFILDRWLPEVTDSAAGSKPGPGLPPGRFLVFGATVPPPLGVIDEGKGDLSVIIDWSRNHPVMRNVGLETLQINPARIIKVPEKSPVNVIAQTQSGAAIFETSDERTRAINVTFDINSTNWAFDPGFVLFTASALTYLANDGRVAAAMYRPGDTISDRLPLAARNATIGLPDKSISDLVPTADGRVVFGPVRKTGVYTLSWEGASSATDVVVNGRPRRAVTANLLDSYESVIGTREKAILATGKAETSQQSASKGLKKIWPFLLMAALAVVLFEWWIYNRKVVI